MTILMDTGLSVSGVVTDSGGNPVPAAKVLVQPVAGDGFGAIMARVAENQERSQEIIDEMRKQATQNSAEIREAVEDGKRRIAKLVADGKALPL